MASLRQQIAAMMAEVRPHTAPHRGRYAVREWGCPWCRFHNKVLQPRSADRSQCRACGRFAVRRYLPGSAVYVWEKSA